MVAEPEALLANEEMLNSWRSRGLPDWSVAYNSLQPATTPWHYTGLDPDLAVGLHAVAPPMQHILDVGCGYGSQSAALANIGFAVLGTDISTTAIDEARAQYPQLSFAVDDILNTHLDYSFGAIWDRGCFHIIPPHSRSHYIAQLHQLLETDGVLYLKCLSSKAVNKKVGPQLFSLAEIESYFSPLFDIRFIQDTEYHSDLGANRKALFAVMVKKG